MTDLILIAGHGSVASGLKGAAEVILGEDAPVVAAPAYVGDMDQIDQAVSDALAQVGSDGHLFVLTDLLGGSVNTRIAQVTDPRITLISGANLGLVLELATMPRPVMPEALPQLIAAAREGLQLVELANEPEEDF